LAAIDGLRPRLRTDGSLPVEGGTENEQLTALALSPARVCGAARSSAPIKSRPTLTYWNAGSRATVAGRSTGLLGRPLKRSNGEESSRCARWPRWRRIGVSGGKAASPRLRVDQGRNATRGCSDVSQRQAGSVGAVCEQRLPSPEDDWVNHEPI